MVCINCRGVFHNRPFKYYFCSKICWEDASKNIPWSILSDDVEPLDYPVKATTSPRHPRFPRQRKRTPRPVKPDDDYRWLVDQPGTEAADTVCRFEQPKAW
ncbi:hypothetical protein RFN29_24575 [Mesorhizobium sp. VK22B]|uniref:Uncharacterized protein n=1 Tax=Mesorhizobium captivum TaxID=3072319 RepID=A0ABU4Z674_9HYPH|nr:hypothetical protein [Mesorhizobium sp. VK22B]MDX8494749.1 hypothetical protein [Mesorhizobium sp. VK22B]